MPWNPKALVRRLSPAPERTESSSTLEPLAQEPASWRAVAEASGAVFLQWDFRSGRLLDLSENIVNLLGYSRQEFMEDQALFQRVTPVATAESINEMIQSWARLKPARVRFEEDFIDRKGRAIVLEMTGELEYTAEQELAGARLMAVDVTDLAYARQRAMEGMERYRSVFEGCPMPMWLLDPETLTIVEANEQACQLYRMPRADLEGTSLMERVVPEERQPLRERVRRATVWGQFDVIPRSLRLRGDRTLVPISLVAGNVILDGKVRRLVIARDISEEDRLRGWSARYRDAFRKGPHALFVLDRTSLTVVEANERTSTMYGMPPEEVEGAGWTEVTGDAAGAVELRALAEGPEAPGQFSRRAHHRRSDGSRFPVEVTVVPIEGESRGRWLAAVRDRSDEEMGELSFAAMRMAVDEADLAVLFMSSAGHIVYASSAVSWLTGRTPEDLVGRSSMEVLAPGEELAWVSALRKVMDGGSWAGMARLAQPGEESRHVRVRMMAVHRPVGIQPAFVLAILRPAGPGEDRAADPSETKP